jgi:predicted glycoside hydrolase/deacetylase ChbG (UPF0249 family)
MIPNGADRIGVSASSASDGSPARAIPVVLCADDYGVAPGVGRAIRDLLARGRLSAASCMVTGPHWPEEARALREFRGRADVGLHLTLTDRPPLGDMPLTAPDGRLPPLGRLMALAFAGRLARAEAGDELERQLDRFEREFGRPPDFLDGHHHVHLLPGVREIVVEGFRRRLAPSGAYVRYCDDPGGGWLGHGVAPARAAVIRLLGRPFRRLGRAAGIPGNTGFRGVRAFTESRPYARIFPRYLDGIPPGSLIMCHPGIADAALAEADRATDVREDEYRYFLGEEFRELLRSRGIALARLRP